MENESGKRKKKITAETLRRRAKEEWKMKNDIWKMKGPCLIVALPLVLSLKPGLFVEEVAKVVVLQAEAIEIS